MTNQHDAVLYIGMTNSLGRRISRHRSGEIAGFTADYRCHKLIYWEHYNDVRDAIERETQLKKWSRAKKITLINAMNPRWLDLSDYILGEEYSIRDVSRLRSTTARQATSVDMTRK